ncbi:phosphoglycolate phosphatase [Pseudidiomarina mangrovi]|uniref:phosphoglycolate phosphatase n=1 Tax=Pseudidiomarina mangrovi TaxID=2487133 RepID=UPI00196B4B2E|nr:phosphoglycolate phosphatase [Pseudidiomarina mangrovi]
MQTIVMPQAVLFDLDGTLLDTADDLGAALNAVLAAEQRPLVAAEHYTPLASHGSAGLLRFAFGEQFEQRKDELRQKFLAYYADHVAVHTRLYDGVELLLQQLAARGILAGIVTNKPHALTQLVLPYFPSLQALPVVVSGDTLNVAKPHPQPLLHAADQLQVVASRCWYVGDAERDIQAGRAAGMHTVLARYGYIHANDQPEAWGAHAAIEQPQQLLELLSLID